MSEKKDAIATMGAILPDDVSGRDAVHVAVISAVAGEELLAATDVGIASTTQDGEGEPVARTDAAKLIGIVDPFLCGTVRAGQRFWLFVYPRTITGLKHVWTHPDVASQLSAAPVKPTADDVAAKKAASEKWLRDFCEKSDCPGFISVMGIAEYIADGGSGDSWDGEYMHFDGLDAHGPIPPEFWDHVEIWLGRKVQGKKATGFSCSC